MVFNTFINDNQKTEYEYVTCKVIAHRTRSGLIITEVKTEGEFQYNWKGEPLERFLYYLAARRWKLIAQSETKDGGILWEFRRIINQSHSNSAQQ